MSFSEEIIRWYNANKRQLPWRDIRDPYRIWLSEIMLQQTRVIQAKDYYLRFINRFPNVESLAKAEEREVLHLWQGLGYYSRARNLHTSAQVIYYDLENHFPSTYGEIVKLKGIGDYTASAIASFAFGESKPVLDGNVFRFFARYFGIHEPKDNSVGLQEVRRLLNLHISNVDPADFNQAIMEFGALQCVPKSPQCESCPIQGGCYAWQHRKVEFLPTSTRKIKQRKRYLNYFIYRMHGNIFIRKRIEKDIWQNLYEFPIIETSRQYSFASLQKEYPRYFDGVDSINVSKVIKHILSHQQLFVKFYTFDIERSLPILQDYMKIKEEKIVNYPFSRLILKYWEEIKKEDI